MSELEELTAGAGAVPARSRADLAELLDQSLEEQDEETIEVAWLVEVRYRDREIGPGACVVRPADEGLKSASRLMHSGA